MKTNKTLRQLTDAEKIVLLVVHIMAESGKQRDMVVTPDYLPQLENIVLPETDLQPFVDQVDTAQLLEQGIVACRVVVWRYAVFMLAAWSSLILARCGCKQTAHRLIDWASRLRIFAFQHTQEAEG